MVRGRRKIKKDPPRPAPRRTYRVPWPGVTALLTALVFVGVFFWAALVVDPAVIYHGFGVYFDWPAFHPAWTFLREHLAECGGPLRYVTGFLSQWFYYRWLGALIITAVAGAIYLAIRLATRTLGASVSRLLGHIGVLCFLVGYSQYDHVLSVGLAVAVVGGLVILHEVPERFGRWRLARFAVLISAAYYLVGASGLLMAAVVVGRECLDRRLFSGVLHAAVAVVSAILLGGWWSIYEARDTWLGGTPFHPAQAGEWSPTTRAILQGLYVGLVVVLIVAHWPVRRTRAMQDAGRPDFRMPHAIRHVLATGLPGLAGGLILYAAILPTAGSNTGLVLSIHRHSRLKDWPAVLAEVERLNTRGLYDPCSNFDANHALYHIGRLPYDLFYFPQNPDALTLFGAPSVRPRTAYSRIVRWYYELGDLNNAEHWASELLETEGTCPLYLELLGRICVAKGRTAAARVYLKALSRDPVYGPVGQRLLAGLERDPETAADPEIRRIRALRRRVDKPVTDTTVEQALLDLLAEQPNNRMAFEYLMAHYLLQRQPERLVAHLHRLRPLGYTELPPLYAEAVLVYSSRTREGVDLHGYAMDPRHVERFERITGAFRAMGYDRSRGMAALASEFAHTYFYYAMFPVEVGL